MTGVSLDSRPKSSMRVWHNRWFWGLLLLWWLAATPVLAANKPIRAMHFVVINLTVADAKRLIDEASQAHFNTLIMAIPKKSGLKLDAMPWIVKGPLTWSSNDLREVVAYARHKQMEVIPHLPLLSHQEQLLAPYFPELLYNASTYDPRNERVYNIVLPIIDELITIVQPKAVLIGHDEVVGWSPAHYTKGKLKPGEKMLPPELFLHSVNRLHAYLKKKNVETWMYGDMLIAPSEFPSLPPRAEINGSAPGYGKTLRQQLPKEIVICDWHYQGSQSDFPTLAAFRADGFRVLGMSWRERTATQNFSRYAARHGADGMIASTWIILGAKGNSVVNNWDDAVTIIRESGAIFRKEFPD